MYLNVANVKPINGVVLHVYTILKTDNKHY